MIPTLAHACQRPVNVQTGVPRFQPGSCTSNWPTGRFPAQNRTGPVEIAARASECSPARRASSSPARGSEGGADLVVELGVLGGGRHCSPARLPAASGRRPTRRSNADASASRAGAVAVLTKRVVGVSSMRPHRVGNSATSVPSTRDPRGGAGRHAAECLRVDVLAPRVGASHYGQEPLDVEGLPQQRVWPTARAQGGGPRR